MIDYPTNFEVGADVFLKELRQGHARLGWNAACSTALHPAPALALGGSAPESLCDYYLRLTGCHVTQRAVACRHTPMHTIFCTVAESVKPVIARLSSRPPKRLPGFRNAFGFGAMCLALLFFPGFKVSSQHRVA